LSKSKPPSRIFLDASVLFAGCDSASGALWAIMDVALRGELTPMVNETVLMEADRSIRSKSSAEAYRRFNLVRSYPGLEIGEFPSVDELKVFAEIIVEKDRHVLASAKSMNAEAILTLDAAHFFTEKLRNAGFQFMILAPGVFMKMWREANAK
jgi:predicted nucleic acid-binding protein